MDSKLQCNAAEQCTVVGKGDFNYFSIFDFIESEQTFDDI